MNSFYEEAAHFLNFKTWVSRFSQDCPIIVSYAICCLPDLFAIVSSVLTLRR